MEKLTNKADAQNLVDRIIADNDTSKIEELTLNADDSQKKNILASIKKLDMSPLSTPVACS
jgi:hypothetical protein